MTVRHICISVSLGTEQSAWRVIASVDLHCSILYFLSSSFVIVISNIYFVFSTTLFAYVLNHISVGPSIVTGSPILSIYNVHTAHCNGTNRIVIQKTKNGTLFENTMGFAGGCEFCIHVLLFVAAVTDQKSLIFTFNSSVRVKSRGHHSLGINTISLSAPPPSIYLADNA